MKILNKFSVFSVGMLLCIIAFRLFAQHTTTILEPNKIIVIGSGAAGIGFVTEFITQKAPHSITWITSDIDNPYQRTKLDSIISGKNTQEKIILVNKLPKNIDLQLGKTVTKIDAQNKSVCLDNGTTYFYDYLFLATGSTPTVLPHYSDDKEPISGIFNFYTLEDARRINNFIKQHSIKNAVIIGCGINGLEVADVLQKRGFKITLVDKNEHILQNYFNDIQASLVLENTIKKQNNVVYYPKSSLKNIIQKDGKIEAIELNNGTCITTNLLITTIGVQPNLFLAKTCGLTVQNNALVVDNKMKTSNQWIYAGGDIALVYDQGTKSMVKSSKWGDAMKQGQIAALTILGKNVTYDGAFIGYKTSFLGNELFISGLTTKYPTHFRAIKKSGDDFYHTLILDKQFVKGFYLINNITQARRLRRALQEQTPFNVERFLKR